MCAVMGELSRVGLEEGKEGIFLARGVRSGNLHSSGPGEGFMGGSVGGLLAEVSHNDSMR